MRIGICVAALVLASFAAKAAAELRLGDRRSEQRVRIVRDDGRRGRP